MTFRAGQTFFRANQRLIREGFLGLIPGFFGQENLAVFFGWLDSSRDFVWADSNQSEDSWQRQRIQPRSSENKVKPNLFQLFSFCGSFNLIFNTFWIFLRLGNSAWDFFGGVNVCWRPQGFLGVLIFTPLRLSQSLEFRSIFPLGSQRQPYRFKTTLRNKKKVLSLFHLNFIPHDNLTDEAIFFSFF